MPAAVFDLDLETTDGLQPKFSPLPNGHYDLVIAKQPEVADTKPSEKNPQGAVMIKLEYTTNHPETGNQQRVWDNIVLSKDALWKVRQWLLSLGYTGKMSTTQVLDPDFLSGIVGQTVTADLQTKKSKYNGTESLRTNVAQYTSVDVPSRNIPNAESTDYADGHVIDSNDIPF